MSAYVNPSELLSSASESSIARYWRLLNFIQAQWGETKVSSLSLFLHNVWDLRKEGARYRFYFDVLIGSEAMTHLPMRILLKSLVFILLGRMAVTDRAPRTVYNILSSAKQLIEWLVERKCLVADVEGGYFKLPRDITLEEFSEFFREVNSQGIHQNTKWDKVRLLSEWWNLSNDEGGLPSFLRLPFDPFDNKNSVIMAAVLRGKKARMNLVGIQFHLNMHFPSLMLQRSILSVMPNH